MANTGAGKGGKGAGGAGEKAGGSDTLNFTYSSAVEAALEQLEKDKEEEARPTPRRKKTKKAIKEELLTDEAKPKQKIEVYKLNEIYDDWCHVRELNTPRTSRSQQAAPPSTRNSQAPTGISGTDADAGARQEETQSQEKREEKRDHRKEEKASPEERRKRERDKEDESGNKSAAVRGT